MGRRLRGVLVAVLLAASLQATVGAPAAVAGVGGRDTSYGTNGETWVDTASGDLQVRASRVLADGSTLTAGWTTRRVAGTPPTVVKQLVTVRAAADGTPGPIRYTTIPGWESISHGAGTFTEIGPDGSVVVSSINPDWAGILYRVRPDGALDPAFGGPGGPGIAVETARDLVLHDDGSLSVLQVRADTTTVLRLTATGAVDTTFGDDGRVTEPKVSDYEYRQDLDLTSGPGRTLYLSRGYSAYDGKPFPSPVLERWTPSGQDDTTFAGDGTLELPFAPRDLAVEPSGRLTFLLDHSTIARVLPNGTFDASFDGDGVTARLLPTGYNVSALARLAVLADGSVYAIDSWSGMRGVLDPAGTVVVPFGRAADRKVSEVALLTVPGGVLLAGSSGRSTPVCCNEAMVGLQRYRPDGTTDATFGDAGLTRVPVSSGGEESVLASWIDAQGRLVVVTQFAQMWGMTRLLPSGAVDPAFGDGGAVKVFTPVPNAVIGTADGGIASIGLGKGGGYGSSLPMTDLVQRFDASGRPVATFGTAGQVHFDAPARTDRLSIAELPLGGLAVVRSAGLTVLTPAGTPDPTFGGTGTVVLPEVYYQPRISSALRHDGIGLVVATSASGAASDGRNLTTLRRYLPTGAVDPTYGVAGSLELPSTSYVKALQPVGALGAAAWYVTGFDGSAQRVLLNGLVDPSFTPVAPVEDAWAGGTTSVDAVGRLLVTYGMGGYRPRLHLRRFLPTGTLDPSFGDDGVLKIDRGLPQHAITTGNRILVIGMDAADTWVLALKTTEPGIPTVSIASATVVEGGTAELKVTLDRPGESAVVVKVEATDGTARPSDDPLLHEGSYIGVPAGQTSATVTLPTRQDALYEGDERIRFEITDAEQAEVGQSVAYLTIKDDDPVGDVPGAPLMSFVTGDELRFWSDPARPGASTPTLMTVMVFDGNRLGWWRQVNGDRGRVQVPIPPPGKTFRVYVAASNPQGTSPLAGPIVYGNKGTPIPMLPTPDVTNTREGVLVKWDTDKFYPDLVFSSAPIWSVIATSADGKQVLHASNHTAETRGVVLDDLPKDQPVKVLLVGWFAGGPLVSEPKTVVTSTASNEPYLGVVKAPTQLELARKGATPSVMWSVEKPGYHDPAIDGFVVRIVRNGTTVSTREYPATVRNAPLDPNEITGGATVEVSTKSYRGLATSEPVPAAWLP